MKIQSSLLASLFLVAGCSGGSAMNTFGDSGNTPPDMAVAATPDMARPPLGMPLTAAMNVWTWNDFPDSTCDDGTPTGIGVNMGDPRKLLIFLNGGGACWDYTTCITLGTATHGPFGKKEFDANLGGNVLTGSLFDRTAAGNPFKDYSFVFVPYCTGDLHGGDNIATYAMGNDSHMYRHKGHANLVAFAPRIAATFPVTDKFIVSGSSAGGFGTGINYDFLRRYFPSGESYMLDDSGPPIKATDFPSNFRDAFFASWNLGAVLDPICPTCRMELADIIPTLAKLYPNDRFSLLSSLQDKTIRGYLLLSPSGFQTAILDLAATVIDPQPRFKYFFVPGESHTMLGNPAKFTSQGVALNDWLTQFVSDDPKWMSLKP